MNSSTARFVSFCSLCPCCAQGCFGTSTGRFYAQCAPYLSPPEILVMCTLKAHSDVPLESSNDFMAHCVRDNSIMRSSPLSPSSGSCFGGSPFTCASSSDIRCDSETSYFSELLCRFMVGCIGTHRISTSKFVAAVLDGMCFTVKISCRQGVSKRCMVTWIIFTLFTANSWNCSNKDVT